MSRMAVNIFPALAESLLFSRCRPMLINKPFPAEHPYSSHIPRNALIPKFSDSPEDPKRGVKARSLPINNEMPACPYDITVVSKTKGAGFFLSAI